MMLSVILILVLAALIVAIMAGVGKAPLWVSVILLCIIEAIRVLPLR